MQTKNTRRPSRPQSRNAKRHMLGPESPSALSAASSLVNSLIEDNNFAEAKALISETLPIARRVYGDAHDITLGLRYKIPHSIVLNPDATRKDLHGAKEELEDLLRTTRRIFGNSHPRVQLVRDLIGAANHRLSNDF